MLMTIVTTLMWIVLAISAIILSLSLLIWVTPGTKKQKKQP